MTLNIGSSLTGGIRRIANRNGFVLLLAYLVTGLVWQVTFYSAFVTWLEPDVPMDEVALPSVDAPIAVLAAGAILSLLVLQYLSIVSLRTFVGGHARSIPSEYLRRSILFVLVNSILGAIAYGVLVTLGTILLVVPGIIAYLAFAFTLVYIAVEDENFIAALRASWTLTRGNWLRLFALFLIVFVGIGIVGGVFAVLVELVIGAAVSPGLGTLVSGLIYLSFSLFTIGTLAEAFTQLRADNAQTA